MIEMAMRRNREHVDAGRAELEAVALEDADLGDRRFDKVFAFNVAPFWLQPKEALGIVRRHLAPDGAVLSLLGCSPHAARPSSRPGGPAEREDPAGRVLREPSAGQEPAPGSRGLRDRAALAALAAGHAIVATGRNTEAWGPAGRRSRTRARTFSRSASSSHAA